MTEPTAAAPAQPNLALSNETMLGICEAIGRDFGFPPNLLRVALGLGCLVNPLAMFGLYLALGAVVLASRLLFPAPAAPASETVATATPAATAEPAPVEEREPELLAA
jgi:phage shock protein C